jgi:hypothetical protein
MPSHEVTADCSHHMNGGVRSQRQKWSRLDSVTQVKALLHANVLLAF